MTRYVTVATMIATDGFTTVYGIFRARLSRFRGQQCIDLCTAERVGCEIISRGPYPSQVIKAVWGSPTWEGPFDYYQAAKKYETADAPAFAWAPAEGLR